MIRRIRQFILSIYLKLGNEDLEYINKKLDKNIINDFSKLSSYEKKHSILVAHGVETYLKSISKKDEELVLAALLHDIGKSKYHINIIEKSLLVILDNITTGKLKNYTGNKSIYIYYNHGKIGYDILKDKGYSERILSIIKNHQDKKITSDDLKIIRKFDNMY